MAPDEFAWLRDVLENSAHLEHLAAMLDSDLIFQEGFGPLLRDLLARGWVSRADLELWRSRPVGSRLRLVVRRQSALDAENS